ncbi:MAG: exodeoxyribonuclease VII small subunit [Anaerovorax sp.]
MATKKEELTFEKALEGLENCASSLKNEGSTLEGAMKNFEEGIKYYNYCNDILNTAKQKIQVYKGEKQNE